MTRTVICISRTGGGGGEEVGRLVADRLGYRLVDEEILARAADKEGVSPEQLADVERRKSWLTRIMSDMGRVGYVEIYPGPDLAFSDDNALRARIRETIAETAAEGQVVIVSHAASYALAARADVLRVFVTASDKVRADRLVAAGAVEERKAAKLVSDDDAGRAQYLKNFYGVKAERPSDYDLVVSTDTLTPELVADLVVKAAA